MNKQLPNLKPGLTVLKIVKAQRNKDGSIRVTHEPYEIKARNVWRTFKLEDDRHLRQYLEKCLGLSTDNPTQRQLSALEGLIVEAMIKPGKSHFMNLVYVKMVLGRDPLFNKQNQVNDPNLIGEGHAGQIES